LSGSVVVLDVTTGEVLAMVNQPAFNPNDREQFEARRYRNRAVTDIFEPGSSIKPFASPPASQSGKYAEQRDRHVARASSEVGSKDHRGQAQPRRDHLATDPREVVERRHDAHRAVARAAADLEHAERLGFGR
jgi:cell division protein FtsI/penicillin-binding protein 2